MTKSNVFNGFIDGEEIITIFDGNGNKILYNLASSKKDDGHFYILTGDVLGKYPADNESFLSLERLIFKYGGVKGNDVVFELIDDYHTDFEVAFELFENDLEAMDMKIPLPTLEKRCFP